MKIIYTPKTFPAMCSGCKTIFIPDEAGDLEVSTDRIVAACPRCSAYCEIEFVSDGIVGIHGSDRLLDARTKPPYEGEIIAVVDEDGDIVIAKSEAIFEINEEKDCIECVYATVIESLSGTEMRGHSKKVIMYYKLQN